MSLQSPGIESKETSLQTVVVNNSTGRAAIVGKFNWGPAFQIKQVTQEPELSDLFGQPDDMTADYYMSSANFLRYGNDLRVVRVVNQESAKNASPLAGNIDYTITNSGSNYEVGDTVRVKYMDSVIEDSGRVIEVDRDGKIQKVFIPTGKVTSYAKSINQYPALSSSWTIDVVSKSSGIASTITHNGIVVDSGILLTTVNTSKERVTSLAFLEKLSKYGLPAVVGLYPGELGDNIEVEIVSYDGYRKGASLELDIFPTGGKRSSSARSVFQFGPQNENEYGFIVRRSGSVVESFILSTEKGAKNIYNSNVYIDDYFANGTSGYIFATAEGFPKGYNGIIQLSGGLSANNEVTAGDLMQGWDLFADRESIYVNLMIAGACAGEGIETASTVQKYAVAIADERNDGTVFVSPPKDLIVGVDEVRATDNIEDWRQGTGEYETNNFNISSNRMVIDGNYKYQYDKNNDVNRWIPLSADIAGCCVRTDVDAYTWNSPAGVRRGQILNCIELACNFRQTQRDRLYQVGVNPVINAGNGDGFILYGDKTGTSVPTPFDRVNVRRLFNMLEKNINDMAKYILFENNDEFTRNSFRMETTQYLAGIKALGGIYDFRVICDTTNNTPSVIDRNEFVATFLIQPARSINYITLNYVATATGADFDEIVGTYS